MFASEVGAFDVPPGTVVAGRYRVEERIARGGHGVVYRVEHVHTGERFAMKVLGAHVASDPEALRRFKHEMGASARIRSENVVLVTDADTAPELGGAPFMVMELLRGSDLESHAKRVGKMSADEVVAIMSAIASVLEHAHRVGIVHRDLKPENVFLHERADGTRVVKVLDFGISKLLAADEASGVAVTTTGAILGTPLYMAPEQAHGRNDAIVPSTDLWATGLIAVRLLAGEHYWGTPTMPELMAKITAAPMVPPSERWPDVSKLTPSFDAWFSRSCAREPEKRWSSADEQFRALVNALDASSTTLTVGSMPALAAERAPRIRRGLVVAVAAALVALSLFAWTSRARHEPATASSSAAPPEAKAAMTPSTVAPLPATGSAAALPAPSAAPTYRATTPARVAASATPTNSGPTCREGEVISVGHCCPPGHVWQSGRCARPIATSF